jgi:NADPH:quinone reductase-like Zn-dependent oxidoreductase
MKAIILKDFGGVDQLIQQDVPKPAVKDNEVLVRTCAIGLNPVDVKTRKGKGQAARLKNEHPMILGWDISGEVAEVGSKR